MGLYSWVTASLVQRLYQVVENVKVQRKRSKRLLKGLIKDHHLRCLMKYMVHHIIEILERKCYHSSTQVTYNSLKVAVPWSEQRTNSQVKTCFILKLFLAYILSHQPVSYRLILLHKSLWGLKITIASKIQTRARISFWLMLKTFMKFLLAFNLT
jgi:hypothetical protein